MCFPHRLHVGENTIHPETYTVADANIAVANPTRAGYTFTGWTVTTAPTVWGTGSTTTGGTSMVIATGTYGNIVLTANWIVACPENYFVPNDHPEMCFPHRLHVGENMVFMKSDKLTTPSLNVRVGNDVFYANMTTVPTYMSSAYQHYFKTIYNGSVYYVCDDTTYNPDAEIDEPMVDDICSEITDKDQCNATDRCGFVALYHGGPEEACREIINGVRCHTLTEDQCENKDHFSGAWETSDINSIYAACIWSNEACHYAFNGGGSND
jgi:uncharacterized repeat protein (TIGR02543 family)